MVDPLRLRPLVGDLITVDLVISSSARVKHVLAKRKNVCVVIFLKRSDKRAGIRGFFLDILYIAAKLSIIFSVILIVILLIELSIVLSIVLSTVL